MSAETWIYSSEGIAKAEGDFVTNSPFYAANMKIILSQQNGEAVDIKYFLLTSVEVVEGWTYLTLDGQGKYTLADATILSHQCSTWSNPTAGFPLTDPAYASANHDHVAADVHSETPEGKFLKDNGTWDTPGGGSGGIGGYDSIVYVNGSDVIAKNATGTTIDSGVLGTEDAAVIQAAINAGGAVLLQYSLFTLESPLVFSTSGVRLFGNSRLVTLKAKDSLNDNMIEITGTGVSKVTLSNLILDGNKGNQTSGNGIYINTPYSSEDAHHLIEKVLIKNPKGYGITIEGDTRCCKMDHVVVMDADGSGYVIAGSDHLLNDVSAGACKTGGFNISAGSIKANFCKAFYCGQTSGVGIYIAGDRGTYIGCEAQDNYSSGWMLDGAENCLLTNCIGDSNGTSEDWQSGLILYNCVNIIVTSGAFFDRQGTPTQHWGVHLTGTSTGCVVTYPSYWGNVTADYYDESSGQNYEIKDGKIKIESPSEIRLKAPDIILEGDVTITGNNEIGGHCAHNSCACPCGGSAGCWEAC